MFTKFCKAIVGSALPILAVSLVFHACAAGKVNGSTSGSGGEQGTTTTGSGGVALGGSGGKIVVPNLDLDAANFTPPDTRKADMAVDAKPLRCDNNGKCTCLSILSLGQPAIYGGSSDTTDAFQKFMNGNTAGTATMDMLKTQVPLTKDLLSKYDVVILQELVTDQNGKPWSYSDDEVKALENWVKVDGGSVIAMSGYYNNMKIEIEPLNQLLAPFGIQYGPDNTFDNKDCPDEFCYCAWGAIRFNGWQQTDDNCKAITVNHDPTAGDVILGNVGVFLGHTITCTNNDCSVFAKDPKYGIVGAAKVVGNGRVVAWQDEWVTYTSQWGLTRDGQWDKAPQCKDHTPADSFVVPQFWYNVFKWAAPTAACFVVEVPPDAPPGQQVIL